MTRLLHVANGTSTTRLIQRAGIPGALSEWGDVLSEGPVPGSLTDAQLIDVRARHLASAIEPTADEVAADLRRWRAAIDDEDYDELILWYEHDLFDQLNLIQLLAHIGAAPRRKPASLICIDSYPGRPDFKGLGELTPDEIRPLLDARRPVTGPQTAVSASAWTAFRSPNPTAIERLLAQDTTAMPFLAAALRRWLEEYPWTTDGLSRSERRLMALASHGADIQASFPRMHDAETAFYITDGSYWSLIEGLALASPAFVELHLGSHCRVRWQLPTGRITLSDAGRAVLAEEDDRVRRAGVDRWLGGVHLEGRGPVWRWDPAASRLRRA